MVTRAGQPCFHSLAIDEVVKAVKTPLYLDDGTIGGSVGAICSDLNEAMANVGLTINSGKCEIILPADITDEQRKVFVASLRQFIPGAAVTDEPGRTILGAPISEAATEAVILRAAPPSASLAPSESGRSPTISADQSVSATLD